MQGFIAGEDLSGVEKEMVNRSVGEVMRVVLLHALGGTPCNSEQVRKLAKINGLPKALEMVVMKEAQNKFEEVFGFELFVGDAAGAVTKALRNDHVWVLTNCLPFKGHLNADDENETVNCERGILMATLGLILIVGASSELFVERTILQKKLVDKLQSFSLPMTNGENAKAKEIEEILRILVSQDYLTRKQEKKTALNNAERDFNVSPGVRSVQEIGLGNVLEFVSEICNVPCTPQNLKTFLHEVDYKAIKGDTFLERMKERVQEREEEEEVEEAAPKKRSKR